jgi:hypothetical protein
MRVWHCYLLNVLYIIQIILCMRANINGCIDIYGLIECQAPQAVIADMDNDVRSPNEMLIVWGGGKGRWA